MSSQRLRVVVFSGVRHARNYADVVSGHGDFDLIGVYESPNAPEWAQRDTDYLAAELGLDRLADLSSPIDLVIVCSEPTRHATCAAEALQAGCHVLVDKPAATTLSEVRSLRELALERQLICTSVNRTLLSGTQRAKALIDAGHIGFARSVDVEFLSDGAQFSSAVERPELVVDPSLSGGGEIMNFMGYCVDSVRVLTGCDPLELFALSTTAFSSAHRATGVEDVAAISMLCTNGVVATITVGRVPAAPSVGPGASSVRIIGSHGHLMIDDAKPAVTLFRAEGADDEIPAHRHAHSEAIIAVLDDVSAAIRVGRPLRYTIDDAAHTIAAIEATYESIHSGQCVAVRPIY